MDSRQTIRERTVVLTLQRGARVQPFQFLPFFECVRGHIVAFGTVGQGHVWQVTLGDRLYAEALVGQGNFSIGNNRVSVTKLDSGLHTAYLYWCPFFVSHADVERAFNAQLAGKVASEYIKMKQEGFSQCFSTQRRIISSVDLSVLPHFLNVTSEGKNYRCFVFVPGRPTVCFNCGQQGHMRSKCASSGLAVNPPSPVSPVESFTTEDIIYQDQIVSNVQASIVSEDLVTTPTLTTPPFSPLPNASKFLLSPIQVRPPLYKLKIKRLDGSTEFVTFNNSDGSVRDLVVSPPFLTELDQENWEKFARHCREDSCYLIDSWSNNLITYEHMCRHLNRVHRRYHLVEV